MRKAFGVMALVVAVVFAVGAAQAAPRAQQQAGQEKPKETPKEAAKDAAADPVSGEWEGTVDTPNGPIPFFMKLKVDGKKVTGEIGSAEGASPLEGTWTDGKLSFTFAYMNDTMTMSGAMKEAALAGDVTTGGGMAMTWVANKKK